MKPLSSIKNPKANLYSQVQVATFGLQHDLDIVGPVVHVLGRDRESEELALTRADIDKALAASERSFLSWTLLRVPPASHGGRSRSGCCDRCSGN